MPKRKNKTVQVEGEANANVNAICGLCCKPIIEDRDDALLCEGSCDKWLHRYCAGVTETQYEALQDSTLPFLSFICSQLKQATVIKVMQAKIDMLTAEVTELRSTVSDLNVQISSLKSPNKEPSKADAMDGNTWTEVVRRGRRQVVTDTAGSRSKYQSLANRHSQQQISAPRRTQRPMQGVSVPGARRIWGTLKSTTTRAVENVITTLTKVRGSELKIKRKYKTATGNSTHVVRWWFVVRAEESVLEQVQKEWNQVAMQTNWKFTPLLQHAKPISEAQLNVEQATPSHNATSSMEQAAPGVQQSTQQSTHDVNDNSICSTGNNIKQSSHLLDNLQTFTSRQLSQTQTPGAGQPQETEQSDTADTVNEVTPNDTSVLSNESNFLDK